MRRVQVVDVDLVLDGLEAELVGRAVDVAALDAAAGQPHREAVVVVVAAVDLAGVRAGRRQLDRRRAAELAAPDDQRVVEQPALLQVREQAPRWPGRTAPARRRWLTLEVVVAVPRLTGAVPDLHEAHAALEQPPGDAAAAGPASPGPYSVADVLRLARDVERVGRLRLHAVGQLERLDARFELRIVAAARPGAAG